MAVLKPKQRMWLAIIVSILSGMALLDLLSYIGLSSRMNLFGGITVGTIVGVLNFVVAYWLYKRQV